MVTVQFQGRLGSDAQLRDSKNGGKFLTFSVATEVRSRNSKERTTDWINVTYSSPNAENLAEYLKKGKHVFVTGSETISTYTNKNGETVPSRDVLAFGVEFVNSGRSEDEKKDDAPMAEVVIPKTEVKVQPVTVPASSAIDDLPF